MTCWGALRNPDLHVSTKPHPLISPCGLTEAAAVHLGWSGVAMLFFFFPLFTNSLDWNLDKPAPHVLVTGIYFILRGSVSNAISCRQKCFLRHPLKASLVIPAKTSSF